MLCSPSPAEATDEQVRAPTRTCKPSCTPREGCWCGGSPTDCGLAPNLAGMAQNAPSNTLGYALTSTRPGCRDLARYAGARLALGLVQVAGVLVVVFVIASVLPGDAAVVIAADDADPARIAQLRDTLGLNRPLLDQLGDWLSGLLRGDLGTSSISRPASHRHPVRGAGTDAHPCGSRWWCLSHLRCCSGLPLLWGAVGGSTARSPG